MLRSDCQAWSNIKKDCTVTRSIQPSLQAWKSIIYSANGFFSYLDVHEYGQK